MAGKPQTRETGQTAPASSSPRRRRPPNPREQFKREQWGRSWGRILSGIGQQVRENRG